MLRRWRRGLDGPFIWLRRMWARLYEPVSNGLLLVATTALLLLAAWVAFQGKGARWQLGLFAAFVVALRLLSTRFSQRTMRFTAFLAILLSIAGLLSLGRAERVDDSRRAARAEATKLASELWQLRRDLGAGTGLEAAQSALNDLRGAEGPRRPPPVPADSPQQAEGPEDPTAKILVDNLLRELDAALRLGDFPAFRRALALHVQLAAIPGLQPDGGPQEPLTRARIAVETARWPVADAELRRASEAVTELCRRSGAHISGFPTTTGPPDRFCDGRGGRAPDVGEQNLRESRTLAVHQAEAGLVVAQASVAVARGGGDTAEKALQARTDALARALADVEKDASAIDALKVLGEGADALVAHLPFVDRNGVPLALAVTGWVLLAGAGIIGYRHLEILNGLYGLGPVRVEGAKDGEADVERFRTYLLWNIPEPGAVPGATALKPVTDLLGAVKGSPAAGWLQKTIEALTAALTIDHGYTVDFKVLHEPKEPAPAASEAAEVPATKSSPATKEPAPPATDAEVVVAVRVILARTKAMVGQHVFRRPTKTQALRSGAYWAAAVILDRSRQVPAWAGWNKDTSDSLAAYFKRDDEGPPKVEDLREAANGAPRSGVLALQLANAEALCGNHLRAFQLALRATTLHPRYLASRYRLAVAASLLASDLQTIWGGADPAERDMVLSALRRYGGRGSTLADALASQSGSQGDKVRALSEFSQGELEDLRRRTGRSRVALRALRLSERSYWRALLRRGANRKRLRSQLWQVIESCKPAVQARGGFPVSEDDLAMHGRRVTDPATLWQVPYNLACYHAIVHWRPVVEGGRQAHVSAAIELLETAVERPGSHQFTRAWADTDPDLESLRDNPRFRRLLDRLPARPEEDGGAIERPA